MSDLIKAQKGKKGRSPESWKDDKKKSSTSVARKIQAKLVIGGRSGKKDKKEKRARQTPPRARIPRTRTNRPLDGVNCEIVLICGNMN
jgi:hypothetical protein